MSFYTYPHRPLQNSELKNRLMINDLEKDVPYRVPNCVEDRINLVHALVIRNIFENFLISSERNNLVNGDGDDEDEDGEQIFAIVNKPISLPLDVLVDKIMEQLSSSPTNTSDDTTIPTVLSEDIDVLAETDDDDAEKEKKEKSTTHDDSRSKSSSSSSSSPIMTRRQVEKCFEFLDHDFHLGKLVMREETQQGRHRILTPCFFERNLDEATGSIVPSSSSSSSSFPMPEMCLNPWRFQMTNIIREQEQFLSLIPAEARFFSSPPSSGTRGAEQQRCRRRPLLHDEQKLLDFFKEVRLQIFPEALNPHTVLETLPLDESQQVDDEYTKVLPPISMKEENEVNRLFSDIDRLSRGGANFVLLTEVFWKLAGTENPTLEKNNNGHNNDSHHHHQQQHQRNNFNNNSKSNFSWKDDEIRRYLPYLVKRGKIKRYNSSLAQATAVAQLNFVKSTAASNGIDLDSDEGRALVDECRHRQKEKLNSSIMLGIVGKLQPAAWERKRLCDAYSPPAKTAVKVDLRRTLGKVSSLRESDVFDCLKEIGWDNDRILLDLLNELRLRRFLFVFEEDRVNNTHRPILGRDEHYYQAVNKLKEENNQSEEDAGETTAEKSVAAPKNENVVRYVSLIEEPRHIFEKRMRGRMNEMSDDGMKNLVSPDHHPCPTQSAFFDALAKRITRQRAEDEQERRHQQQQQQSNLRQQQFTNPPRGEGRRRSRSPPSSSCVYPHHQQEQPQYSVPAAFSTRHHQQPQQEPTHYYSSRGRQEHQQQRYHFDAPPPPLPPRHEQQQQQQPSRLRIIPYGFGKNPLLIPPPFFIVASSSSSSDPYHNNSHHQRREIYKRSIDPGLMLAPPPMLVVRDHQNQHHHQQYPQHQTHFNRGSQQQGGRTRRY